MFGPGAPLTNSGLQCKRARCFGRRLNFCRACYEIRPVFLLTVVTVLALPINLVAGLFGMNVGGIPLAQHRYGFFFVLGPLLVLTALLAYWGLVKRRY